MVAQLKVAQPRINQRTGKHSKACQCPSCIPNKVAAFEERLKLMGPVAPQPGQSVPVRPHWRAQRNYLKNQPVLRDAVQKLVKDYFNNRG